MIAGKPYEKHVVSRYYAIENSLIDTDDEVSTWRLLVQFPVLVYVTFYRDQTKFQSESALIACKPYEQQ